jgi:hypothetical protein
MQVDEPDHHADSCEYIPGPTGTFTSTQTRFGFPDESITVSLCETLERLVCQDDDDDDDDAKIQYSLRFVWLTVQEALLEGPEVIERLADRDGFEAGVERKGHRDAAKKGS